MFMKFRLLPYFNRKLVWLILLLLTPETMHAQDYLNIRFTNGSDNNKELDAITRITFNAAAEQINFYLSDAAVITRNLDEIQKFTFSNTGSGTVLPVELISFTAYTNKRTIVLSWGTATEYNSASFVVEKKSAESWLPIAVVSAAGISNSPRNYSFTDKNLVSGSYTYRLRMTDNDGSFKLSNTVSADIAPADVFTVQQNYPNPFNPSTVICYEIPQAGAVTVTVYDIQGTEIAVLLNSRQDAGSYTVTWDGKNNSGNSVGTGVYICRVQYNSLVHTQKMLLIK